MTGTCNISTKKFERVTKKEVEHIVNHIHKIYSNNKNYLELRLQKYDKYNISIIPKDAPSLEYAFNFFTEYGENPAKITAEKLLTPELNKQFWVMTNFGALTWISCGIHSPRYHNILFDILLKMNKITKGKFKFFISYEE